MSMAARPGPPHPVEWRGQPRKRTSRARGPEALTEDSDPEEQMDGRAQVASAAHRRLYAPPRSSHPRVRRERRVRRTSTSAAGLLDWVLHGAGWLLSGLFQAVARTTGSVGLPGITSVSAMWKVVRAKGHEPLPDPARVRRHRAWRRMRTPPH